MVSWHLETKNICTTLYFDVWTYNVVGWNQFWSSVIFQHLFRLLKSKYLINLNLRTYINDNACNQLVLKWLCNKVISERWISDELTTFTTYLSSLLGVIADCNSNHAQKWGQICVQLVRVSSFRNNLFQNPYFRIEFNLLCNEYKQK